MPITNLNTAPIFSGVGKVGITTIGQSTTNLNSQSPVIGTNVFVAFSSGASGSYVQKVRFQYTSTTNAINSVATVFKIYYSTVNTGTPTVTQIALIADIQAPAQTVTTSTSSYPIEVPLNFAMPASTYLLVGQTIAQTAGSGYTVSVYGGDY
tara:strand:+ start:533 stop:988 length:456 start_codon:yes stop_codon:yes gene_type:complete